MRNSKGFTLVEMLVAMGIFMVVLVMGSYAFERVLSSTGQQTRSAQSNFEGIVGLEMLRYDVEHAGYGLAWGFQNYAGPIKFGNLGGSADQETVLAENVPANGMDSTTLNAVLSNNIQAFTAGTCSKEANNATVANAAGGPDYLVVRSTNSALSDSARKWTYVNYSTDSVANISFLKSWGTADSLTSADRFVTVRSTFTSAGKEDKILLMDALDNFEVTLTGGGAMPSGDSFKPADHSQVVVAYGVRPAALSALRMPYNRTDFYVSRPVDGMPQHCNPGTGILYKAMVNHANGELDTPYPLLDCVGDLQLEFEYDANDDGNISYLPPASLSALSAEEIRSHLKNVRIYVLAQEGKMDRSFNYPTDTIQVGDKGRPSSSGRTLSSTEMSTLFTADWRKYRWKIYTIVTRPKNLVQ